MLHPDELPPSLARKDPALSAVLRQFYGASDESFSESGQRVSGIGRTTHSQVTRAYCSGGYVASEDHDPIPDLGYSGGTNEDLNDK